MPTRFNEADSPCDTKNDARSQRQSSRAATVDFDTPPAHTTVAGVPAKVVGRPASDQPALEMDHDFCCDEAAARSQAS